MFDHKNIKAYVFSLEVLILSGDTKESQEEDHREAVTGVCTVLP